MDWSAFFAGLASFVTLAVVPGTLLILRELRRSRATNERKAEAISRQAAALEGVVRETAAQTRVTTAMIRAQAPPTTEPDE